jgi:isopentenyl-diphosphate delta-isomerase
VVTAWAADGQHAQATEYVVLCHLSGAAAGVAAKATVHHGQTPWHLAFSCYIFDGDDRVLVTQRSRRKRTFPGLWTNSVCGHPEPGERLADAVTRRAVRELGLGISDLRLVLPSFSYEAEMNGIWERELCPVLTARRVPGSGTHPQLDEVEDHRWMPWTAFRDDVMTGALVSPWCRQQVAALAAYPDDVSLWTAGAPGALPGAASW